MIQYPSESTASPVTKTLFDIGGLTIPTSVENCLPDRIQTAMWILHSHLEVNSERNLSTRVLNSNLLTLISTMPILLNSMFSVCGRATVALEAARALVSIFANSQFEQVHKLKGLPISQNRMDTYEQSDEIRDLAIARIANFIISTNIDDRTVIEFNDCLYLIINLLSVIFQNGSSDEVLAQAGCKLSLGLVGVFSNSQYRVHLSQVFTYAFEPRDFVYRLWYDVLGIKMPIMPPSHEKFVPSGSEKQGWTVDRELYRRFQHVAQELLEEIESAPRTKNRNSTTKAILNLLVSQDGVVELEKVYSLIEDKNDLRYVLYRLNQKLEQQNLRLQRPPVLTVSSADTPE